MSNQTIQQEIEKVDKAIAAQESQRGLLSDEIIDAALTQLRQKRKALTAQLQDAPGTSYRAKVKGGGAIAQGAGSTAVGARGVNVGGNVGGSIVTGDKNTVVQGDQVQGDKVSGDKVGGDKISVGNISNSSNLAIGRDAQAHQGISGDALKAIFQTVHQKIQERDEDPNVDKAEIINEVKKIEVEATTEAKPNENKLERWIRNLANMAPDIVEVMVASMAGPVTGATAVLRNIIAKVKKEKNETN
ncbi:MAG: hypothetical protein GY943_13720 [Chloroflexi bacterium]|nr:hypothetical protein [Chloroflexota bacterium]